MPIIERKTLDRVKDNDILLLDAGNLIKAGTSPGSKIGSLAQYNTSFITTISPTREERQKFSSEEEINSLIQGYIERKNREENSTLRFRLKEALMSLYVPYGEKDQLFSVPGKGNFLNEDDLLSPKMDPLNRKQIEAGSSRILQKYKFEYVLDLISQIQQSYNKKNPLTGDKKTPQPD